MAKARIPTERQTCRDCYNCVRGQRFCSRTCRQIGHPLDMGVVCRWHRFEPYAEGLRRQAVAKGKLVRELFNEEQEG